MSLTSVPNRRRLPWVAPAVAVIAVAAVAFVPRAFGASGHPSLPTMTPARLIAAVDASTVRAFSGTVRTTPSLGLPKLPGADGGNQLATLLTEPATWTVAVSGQDKQRVALLGTGTEQDVIHNGSTVWTWDSSTQQATRYTLPGHPATRPDRGTEPTPAALAARILKAVDPTTAVTLGRTGHVAGRSTYTLVITPRTTATLIGRTVIDVDATTKMPLAVTVYPRGSDTAALREAFSSVSFATPPGARFSFTPPRGASVHTATSDPAPGSKSAPGTSTAKPRAGTAKATSAEPHVVGTGWAAVAVVPAGTELPGGLSLASILTGGSARGAGAGPSSVLLAALNAGPNGSRELQTRLLSVLITRSGALYVGAVPVAVLEGDAASGR